MGSNMFEGDDTSIEALLTEPEFAELAKIRKEAGVIGYALIDGVGTHLASDNLDMEALGPIFANAFDIASAIGTELGEAQECPAMFLESSDYELAAIRLSNCSAVIVREKPKAVSRGFGGVS